MRQTQTAVIERDRQIVDRFVSEPFEVGWATEARWFVKTQDLAEEGARLTFVTQLSPDGLEWIDHPTSRHDVSEDGLVTWPVTEFGQWLRVRGELVGSSSAARVMVYLTLKS